jgi:hypothetical protein
MYSRSLACQVPSRIFLAQLDVLLEKCLKEVIPSLTFLEQLFKQLMVARNLVLEQAEQALALE